MKTKVWNRKVSQVSMGVFILLATGYGCKKDKEEPVSAFQYEAVQYTIDQPDGTTVILQSRGCGQGTGKAFFDIYIEDPTGNVTVFRNDVWYTFLATNAADAIGHDSNDEFVSGHLASVDSNYYLDINGGSDQGGVTYQFLTGSIQTMKFCQTLIAHPDTIYVHREAGGNIDVGKPGQWDNIFENSFGNFFWNGSTFTTNATAAHLFFTNYAGARLKEHIVSEVPTTTGTFNNAPGYVITKSIYIYSVTKDANGGIAELGNSFPVKFSLQFTDNNNEILEVRFVPALLGEND